MFGAGSGEDGASSKFKLIGGAIGAAFLVASGGYSLIQYGSSSESVGSRSTLPRQNEKDIAQIRGQLAAIDARLDAFERLAADREQRFRVNEARIDGIVDRLNRREH